MEIFFAIKNKMVSALLDHPIRFFLFLFQQLENSICCHEEKLEGRFYQWCFHILEEREDLNIRSK